MTKKTDGSTTSRATTDARRSNTTSASEGAAGSSPLRVTAHLSSRLTSTYSQTINEREMLSIHALLAYVSHNQNVREDLVQMVLEAELGVDSISHIRRADYERAIAFLVDLKVGDKIH